MQTRFPHNALLSAGLLAIAVLIYWPSVAALWSWWTNDNHSGAHGLLVAPLAVWLLYRGRDRLATVPVRPSNLGAALLVICSVAWLVFWRAGLQELHLLLLPVLMGLGVFAALGWSAALAVSFPIGYLYFAVPAWGIFGGPLQDLTIAAISVLAPLIGIHAQINGDLVTMPGVGIIEIASSCNGVNFFVVGLAVAALLGELEQASLRRRALLMIGMGAAALVSNWLRVLIIIDAGYTTQMRHVLVSRSHYLFGWLLFTTVMVAFVWLLARPPSRRTSDSGSRKSPSPARWLAYGVAVAALAAAPLACYVFAPGFAASSSTVAFAAPIGRSGWQGPVVSTSTWRPQFVGPHSQWAFAYEGPTGGLEAVVVGYPVQAQGRELVNEENSLLGVPGSLRTVADDTVTQGQPSYIETRAVDEHGGEALIWSEYDIGGRTFVTPFLSQIWYGVSSLRGSPYSVLFAFKAQCAPSCDVARTRLSDFARTMGSAFLQSVTRTAGSTGEAQRALTAHAALER